MCSTFYPHPPPRLLMQTVAGQDCQDIDVPAHTFDESGPKRSAKSKEAELRGVDHRCWGLGDPSALRSVRTTSILTRASNAAIAPSAARTGARTVNAPPTTTPVVSGTSSSFSSSGLRMMMRRTLPSSISSLVLSTSSLPAISICSVQVCSSSTLARSTSLGSSLMVLSLLSRHPILPSIVTFAALVLLSSLSRPVVEDRRYAGTSCCEDHRFHSLERPVLGSASAAGFGRRAVRPLAALPAGLWAAPPARARAAHRGRPRSATAPRK